MKKLCFILGAIFSLLAQNSNCQDGRIDSLYTKDSLSLWILKNHIDSKNNWSVEFIKAINLKDKKSIIVNDTTLKIQHPRYENFHLEIKDRKPYQFLIDDELKEMYYIQADIYAHPKQGQKKYMECLAKAARYPIEADKAGKAGMTVMMIYINKKGCLDKIVPLSKLGYGLEDETKRVLKVCDCAFKPSKRKNKSVNTIWIVPLRFSK